MKIAVGADCFGFELKQRIVAWLTSAGYDVVDVGIDGAEADEKICDYADAVAGRVSRGEVERGILLCMSGGMMAIRANRWPQVRAVMAMGQEALHHDRQASDVNVLTVAASYVDWADLEPQLRVFLEVPFEALDRRVRRLARLEQAVGSAGHV